MSAIAQCANAELAVGWALHALEPADEDVMLTHLPDCHICREAVQRTEELIGVLAGTVALAEPRPELRVQVMAAVATTPQTPKEKRSTPWLRPSGVPEGRSITVGWHQDGGGGSDAAVGGQAAERLDAQARAARKRQVNAILITGLIAVIGVGALVYRQVERVAQQGHVTETRPGQLNEILAQIRQPGATYAVLSAPNGEPVAGVTVSGASRQVLPYALLPNHLGESMYVLWGIDGASAVPIGKFDVTASDRSLRPVGPVVRAGEAYRVYVISIERAQRMPPSPGLVVASGQVAD
jgi:hypothetical protein